VVDLSSFTVTKTINTGLHPTGMAIWGKNLLVANTYDDTISVIDTGANQVVRTINLGLPIRVPGEKKAVYGAGPNSIAVDTNHDIAYVALYNANAIAVVDLDSPSKDATLGMIPTAYAPSSIVLDQKNGALIVAEFVRNGSRCDQLQHPSGPWYGKHHPVAGCRQTGGVDRSGLSKQPLGPDAEYPECFWRRPARQGGRSAEEDRRSIADQTRIPDHS
jgi:YVTN family beta-propeller protein